ncbi:MAG TPA: SurA N-terminal domain-containing protein [Sphingomicrobium sp.]|nr:SurA N-terminal domain-containing protein [Sphingomicrobium sp.]
MRQYIIVTALAALAVTSCQKKASGQTVAVVNGEEITASELNSELASEQNAGVGDTKQARNAALQNLINRKLLVQQAKSDGIDKSPEYLTQLRRTTDDLLMNMLLSRRLNTAQVPTADQINQFEASHPGDFAAREVWTLSQLVYPLPKDASVIAKLNAAKSLDEVGQVLTSAGLQFTRGERKLDTAVLPDPIYKQIAKLPQGEPFIANGADKAVASVITQRTPNPTPAEQARPAALALMKREQANQLIQDRVKGLRASAKIEYQPGFAPPGK